MRLTVLTVSLAAALASVCQAQPRLRKEPVVSPGEERAPARPLPPSLRAEMTRPRELAMQPLSTTELALLSEASDPPRVGIHRTLPDGALAGGTWETTADGGRIWRLVVRSPGSAGIRVHFADFSVGSGNVWLHAGDQVAGPYTGRGLFESQDFWSDTIFSEAVTIEYQPENSSSSALPFRVETIVHQTGAPAAKLQPSGLLDGAVTDPADTCHLDPNCYPDWQDSMKMVAHLVFEVDGFEAFCSGALMATRNNNLKPYLLTAGHCISTEQSARTVEAYWTYQKSSCTGPVPDKKNSLKSPAGGHLLTSGKLNAGDYSLLLLRGVPSGVWYAGWDPADPPLEAPLVGIHHPRGSYKRISFGHRTRDQFVVIDNYQNPAEDYYQVTWDKGRIEPGSSGSPLFSGPGIIVGSLTYGPVSSIYSACEINPSGGGYGRFSVAYPSMQDYLEDLIGAAVVPATTSLGFRILNGATSDAGTQTVALTTQSANAVGFKIRADAPWIKVSSVSGQISATSPAALAIAIDPKYFDRAGSFTSTITITSGAAGPQFINIRVDAAVQRSTVAISFTPDPVVEQPPDSDGTRWVFAVKLQERSGVATRITGLKINGTDYSQFITEWFGTDRLDASGTLQATLRASGVFPRGDQYFEFTGQDENSTQSWFQAVTVQFAAP
jgi:lysyl endopeptidase